MTADSGADVKYRQALAHLQAGRAGEAAALLHEIVAQRPDHFDALHMLGAAQIQIGHVQEALHSLDRAVKVNPRNPFVYYNRGMALRALKRPEEALASFNRALALKPDYSEAYTNRGLALRDLERTEEAAASYRRALELKPDNVVALNNLGNIYRDLGCHDDAMACFARAIMIMPNYALAHNNLGTVQQALCRFEDALSQHLRAQALAPADTDANWNEALCRMTLGDLRAGWEKYEWRWRKAEFAREREAFPRPPWLGRENLAGKTILLWGEQGLGDTMQFCRFVGAVAGRGARVVLSVQKPLKRLLSRLQGSVRVMGIDEPLPAFDYHCPLLSLPLALGTTLATIPAEVPYVYADAGKIAVWHERLGPAQRLRVGVTWSGSPGHKNDRNRSIALAEFEPLMHAGVDFISVQKEVRESDRAALAAHGMHHFGEVIEDFDDTAALIACLDLVITVDTAVAHLAGALGKPVWILLPYAPDWRWLLERTDSPWYPTARLYRQPRLGDWADPIGRIAAELRRRSAHAAEAMTVEK